MWVGVGAMVALAGCAGSRIESGVYHSSKGYRIVPPGAAWTLVTESGADLELRHRTERAAMLANADCEPAPARRPLDVLTRQLLLGLRDRVVVEDGEVSLGGRRAAHAVLEGRMGRDAEPMRIEAFVTKDARCVYDFLYVAPPAAFDALRPDFEGFVGTFGRE